MMNISKISTFVALFLAGCTSGGSTVTSELDASPPAPAPEPEPEPTPPSETDAATTPAGGRLVIFASGSGAVEVKFFPSGCFTKSGSCIANDGSAQRCSSTARKDHAGRITVTSLSKSVTMVPDSDGNYETERGLSFTSEVVVSASGGEIPPFALSGSIPSDDPTIVTPLDGAKVSRFEPVKVSWSPAYPTYLELSPPGYTSAFVMCEFRSGKSEALEPVLFKTLTRDLKSTELRLYAANFQRVTRGAYTIDLVVAYKYGTTSQVYLTD